MDIENEIKSGFAKEIDLVFNKIKEVKTGIALKELAQSLNMDEGIIMGALHILSLEGYIEKKSNVNRSGGKDSFEFIPTALGGASIAFSGSLISESDGIGQTGKRGKGVIIIVIIIIIFISWVCYRVFLQHNT
jgi:hypothetical protein